MPGLVILKFLRECFILQPGPPLQRAEIRSLIGLRVENAAQTADLYQILCREISDHPLVFVITPNNGRKKNGKVTLVKCTVQGSVLSELGNSPGAEWNLPQATTS